MRINTAELCGGESSYTAPHKYVTPYFLNLQTQ